MCDPNNPLSNLNPVNTTESNICGIPYIRGTTRTTTGGLTDHDFITVILYTLLCLPSSKASYLIVRVMYYPLCKALPYACCSKLLTLRIKFRRNFMSGHDS
jgi:hypothetical protein